MQRSIRSHIVRLHRLIAGALLIFPLCTTALAFVDQHLQADAEAAGATSIHLVSYLWP